MCYENGVNINGSDEVCHLSLLPDDEKKKILFCIFITQENVVEIYQTIAGSYSDSYLVDNCQCFLAQMDGIKTDICELSGFYRRNGIGKVSDGVQFKSSLLCHTGLKEFM